MSIGVAVFIFANAFKNLKESVDLFLEKTPHGLDVEEIKTHLMEIDGITDVHHIHIRTIDGDKIYATLHIVSDEEGSTIKEKIRKELIHFGITHTTIETEKTGEKCEYTNCRIQNNDGHSHHHCHHHH